MSTNLVLGLIFTICHIMINKSVIQLTEVLNLKHSKGWINFV